MVEEMIKLTEIVSNIVWAVALIEGVLAAILLYLGYKGLANKAQETEVKYFGCEGKGQYRLYGKPAETVKYHCPNCGSHNLKVQCIEGHYNVVCCNCNTDYPGYDTLEEAIEDWNWEEENEI